MRDTARKDTAEHALGVVGRVMGNGTKVSNNTNVGACTKKTKPKKKIPCVPLSGRCQVSHCDGMEMYKWLVGGKDLT